MLEFTIQAKDLIRLKHMLDSTEAILKFTQNKQRNDLDTDRLLTSGIVREFEIGEAAGKISEEVQKSNPQIPWKQIISMRNRLIHAYFDIDHGILWQTVEKELPLLKLKLKNILQNTET